jgi:hypothetical protein
MMMGEDTAPWPYDEVIRRATKEVADTMELVLAMFPESYQPEARVDICNYVLGYMGVSWGLKYGR